jgi:hypothetical protein
METYNIELPKVINNFFTNDELSEFNKYMDNLLNTKNFHFFNKSSNTLTDGWVINHFVGRINITILPADIPENFVNIFEKYKNQINEKAKLSFIELVRYSTKFGNSKINPHIDPSSKQDFMLNVQLKSTKQWPISQFINNEVKTNSLKDNECLIMDVAKDVHWRDPISLEDSDYVDMIFVHYNDNRRVPTPIEWYPHPPEWKEKGKDLHDQYTKLVELAYSKTKMESFEEIQKRIKEEIISAGVRSLLNIGIKNID